MPILTTLFRAAFPADYAVRWFLFQHPTLMLRILTVR